MADLAPGKCEILPRRPIRYGTLIVENADPEIWVDPRLLMDLRYNPQRCDRALSLIDAGTQECDACAGVVCFKDDLLRIEADNQTVVYRIVRWLPKHRCWLAQWPD